MRKTVIVIVMAYGDQRSGRPFLDLVMHEISSPLAPANETAKVIGFAPAVAESGTTISTSTVSRAAPRRRRADPGMTANSARSSNARRSVVPAAIGWMTM